jgi:hypothetical protein
VALLAAVRRQQVEAEGLRLALRRTRVRLWIFHTIPRPGEFGNETWRRIVAY